MKWLNKGVYYVHKRDKSCRPIFIIPVKKLSKSGIDQNLLVGMSCFINEYLTNRAFVPGRVENWVVIFDLKGVGMLNAPKKLIKAVVKPLQ